MNYKGEPGDILFQNRNLRDLGLAIQQVYSGWGHHPVTHCGLMDEGGSILEAAASGVSRSRLEEFLGQSRPGSAVLVGRLREPFRHRIPQALAWARAQLGRPYNFLYLENDPGLYCSQLITQAFSRDHQAPLLTESPLNFQGPDGVFLEYWVRYYENFGIPIPQGQKGSHPATLSRSPHLEVWVLS